MKTIMSGLRLMMRAGYLIGRRHVSNWWEYRLASARAEVAWHNIHEAERHEDGGEQASFIFSEHQGDFVWHDVVVTRRLRREAGRLGVELPPTTDQKMYDRVDWDLDHARPHYFTDDGFAVANKLLREARKERLQLLAARVAMLTGLVGALTGLAAILA